MRALTDLAKRHLIGQATPYAEYEAEGGVPIYVRSDGCWVWDEDGRKYLDFFSSNLCSHLGHAFREEFASAAASQIEELGYWSNWHTAQPPSIKLAAKLASLAPGDLNRVYFCSSGSEANEAAMKMALQYHALREESSRRRFIARRAAYHGLTLGAIRLTDVPIFKDPFASLPGVEVLRVSDVNRYRRPASETEEEFVSHLLTEIETTIVDAGPGTIAAMFVEPIQNAGGMPAPPAGYYEGLRALCDRYGVLLVADEVCTAFGRLGEWFGSIRYQIRPDIITFAKAIAAARIPLAGMVVSDRVYRPFQEDGNWFAHGGTFGGHPVACAVALKNLEIMERERVLDNVRENEPYLRDRLDSLRAKPLVGDVRGAGYFFALELVKDKSTKETFNDAECDKFLREVFSARLLREGVICRLDDRSEPVVQIVPPLIAGRGEIDLLVDALDVALDDLSSALRVASAASTLA